ncbi:MAG: hypothetical protein OXU69_05890 [Gemmatimonadota bacterium]|nr:hypothetical protein [Gemmatimonadota bacterium]MDE2984219.1 hypothetical protein [Gemmatimonadota bacterium]
MNAPTMLRGLLLLALAAAALSAPRPASAQLTRTDTAAALLAVAEDFENRGSHDIAEALYRHILERFPGTAAAETARTRLEAVTSRQSRAGGEVELKVWSTLYGLWQGIAIPLAADADGPEVYGLGLLVGGPAGFLTGRAIARSRPRSLGQARAITWGGTWGAIQGWGWARALDFGKGDRSYGGRVYGEDESDQAALASMIVGGAAGIAGGLALARREITPGTATSAMLGSLWGSWFGFSTAYLADVEGDGLTAAAMLGGNVGLVLGTQAGRIPLSRGRARIISLGGLIGAFGGLGISLIVQPDSDKTFMATILASSAAGLLAGAAGTRDDGGESDPSENLESAASLSVPGSLLNWSQGNWALSTPLPTPLLEPSLRSEGRGGLVWKVPLLKVRF